MSSFPLVPMHDEASIVLTAQESQPDFWVENGVYHASFGREGERYRVKLHGVMNDTQATAAVRELKRLLERAAAPLGIV